MLSYGHAVVFACINIGDMVKSKTSACGPALTDLKLIERWLLYKVQRCNGAREAGCFRDMHGCVPNTVTILDRFHCNVYHMQCTQIA